MMAVPLVCTPKDGGPAFEPHRTLPPGWCGDLVNAVTGEVRHGELCGGGFRSGKAAERKAAEHLKISAPGQGTIYISVPTSVWFPLAEGQPMSKKKTSDDSAPSPDPQQTTPAPAPAPAPPSRKSKRTSHEARLDIIQRLWVNLNRVRNELADLTEMKKQKAAQVAQVELAFASYMSDETPPLFDANGRIVLEAQA